MVQPGPGDLVMRMLTDWTLTSATPMVPLLPADALAASRREVDLPTTAVAAIEENPQGFGAGAVLAWREPAGTIAATGASYGTAGQAVAALERIPVEVVEVVLGRSLSRYVRALPGVAVSLWGVRETKRHTPLFRQLVAAGRVAIPPTDDDLIEQLAAARTPTHEPQPVLAVRLADKPQAVAKAALWAVTAAHRCFPESPPPRIW